MNIDTSNLEIIEFDGDLWHRITDPSSGVDCLYPTDGPGSIDDVIAKYGDDLDAVMQSATRYIDNA
jgi:hypothetical protein